MLAEKNLTLVAFYRSKPDPLTQVLETLQAALHTELGLAFSAYAIEQVHATIIGLEGWRVGAQVYNSNQTQASGKSGAMHLLGLLQFMQGMPALHIRIGGFAASGRYPFTSRGLHPYLRTFAISGSLAVTMGWPFADGSYPMALDSLRRECTRFNVFHKYHSKDEDVDNDFFLVLGRVERDSLSEEKTEYVQGSLRRHLADLEPLDIMIQTEDLSVVAYSDTQLPIASSVSYSLVEAQARIDELILLYPEKLNGMFS